MKIRSKAATPFSRFCLVDTFPPANGPKTTHSLQLHAAHGGFVFFRWYLLQADLFQHFSVPTSPSCPLWSQAQSRHVYQLLVHLHLEKDHLHLQPWVLIESKVWVYPSISWCWSPGRKYCTDLYDPLASLWFFCIQSLLYPSDPGSIFTLNNCAVFSLSHAFSVGSSSLKI